MSSALRANTGGQCTRLPVFHQPSDKANRPRHPIAPLKGSPEKPTAHPWPLPVARHRRSKSRQICAPFWTPFANDVTYEVETNGVGKRKRRRICATQSQVARRAERGATTAPNFNFRFRTGRTSPDAEHSQESTDTIQTSLRPQLRRPPDF